jgi:chromosome segregation ATPase
MFYNRPEGQVGDVADTTVQAAEAAVQQQTEKQKSYSEEEFKKLIGERDKAKERLRLIDEAAKKAAEEKQISEGKAQELLAEKQKRLDELEAKAKLYEDQERTLRESLLGKLNDEADKLVAPHLSVAELTKLVELRSQNKGEPFAGKGQGKPGKLDVNSLGKNYGEIEAELRRRGLAG